MTPKIHRIQTVVPEHTFDQQFARELMKKNLDGNRSAQRLLHRVYAHSGIDKRHSVIADFNGNGASENLFFERDGTPLPAPGTKARNKAYQQQARPLFSKLARETVEQAQGFELQDVTHVITVSCTGFFAPGPDYYVVRDLGLSGHTERYNLGFMGCYAAFPALRMARAFCHADPDAVVLVLCLELCSLHMQSGHNTDSIVSNSVFGDGGGAALVSAREPKVSGSDVLLMNDLRSDLAVQGEQDMAWSLGDFGFEMKLSNYVPGILEENLGPLVQSQLQRSGLTTGDIDRWALHPGGRAIIDKIQTGLDLDEHAVDDSRRVLRNYGNMSSASIFFVLQHILETPSEPSHAPAGANRETILAMAFGPGLTIETGLFQRTGTT